MVSTAGATATGQGFFGRGVQVDSVIRQYDSFLYSQLVGSQGHGAELNAQLDQLSQVNNLFADHTVGITPALNDIFSTLNAAASKPADPAVRQDFIGKANSLVTQINSAYAELQNQREGLNTQISTTVKQINSYVSSINELNQQIVVAQAKTGQPANDLLDQRDQALSELNQLVGIRYYPQGDSMNITLTGGQTLLAGTTEYPLVATQSAADPRRTVLAYNVEAGNGTTIQVEMKDEQVTGGKLGGFLAFRSTGLDQVEDQLGLLAIGLATAMNAQNKQGVDLTGAAGTDLFSLGQGVALSNTDNDGNASMTIDYTDVNKMQPTAYNVITDGAGNYKVTRTLDGTVVWNQPLAASTDPGVLGTMSFDGLTITVDDNGALPVVNDRWLIKPTRDAARDLAVVISDPTKLALSGSYVVPNEDNAAGTTATFAYGSADADVTHDSTYTVAFDGATGLYNVTNASGAVVASYDSTLGDGEIAFDGLTFDLTNAAGASDGDSWTLYPDDGPSGVTNGQNGLKLAKLQIAKLLGNGTMSLNETFSTMINNIGVQTSQVKTAVTAQQNLIDQQNGAVQSVSGVNLNEEYMNLVQFQEQFQANARVIDTASTLFDTLLGLRS
jgi:flagellar hook-associated protein 1 FlgK